MMNTLPFPGRITASLCLFLSLSSIPGKAQEHTATGGHSRSEQAFTDKHAIALMAENFESAERDAMQQPDKVVQYLGPINGKKIMDLGAATGYFSLRFARKGAYVIAADVSDGFQDYLKERIAREKIGNVELRRIPYDNPLLQANEVDLVFMANTYHHIEHRDVYFARVKQGLKAGGALVIVDFFKVQFKDPVQAPAMMMRASVDEVVSDLKQAGFTTFDIEVNRLPYQYIIKAR